MTTTTQRKPPAPKAPHETEAQFQAAVIQLAKQRGWLVNHCYDSRRTGPDKGFPDLCMVRGGRLLFFELKTARGRVQPEQIQWLEALKACGVFALIARPKDWPSIERVLA